MIFILVSSCSSNKPFEDYILAILGLGAVGYLTYAASKGSGSYTVPTYSEPDIEICKRGYYQGCCSHHEGLLGCLNYEVICQDHTISESCTCPYRKCVFD